MRRVVGAGLLTLVLASACAAFGKADDAPAPAEAGAPLDASTDTGNATKTDAATTGCPTLHVFCDDFEGVAGWSSEWTSRVVNAESDPDAVLADEPLPSNLGTGHALHVIITPSNDKDEAKAYLQKELDKHFADDKTTIELHYRVYPVRADVSYVRFGSYVTIIANVGYDAHGASIHGEDELLTHGSPKDVGPVLGIKHSTGAWRLVTVTLSRPEPSQPFTRTTVIDGKLIDERAIDLNRPLALSELEFGAYSSTHAGLGGTFEAWLDDIVFTAQ